MTKLVSLPKIEKCLFNFHEARVYYYKAGELLNPPLLFLHGWPGFALLKSGVIQELAKSFYVMAPEHPGLCGSDPLPHYENIHDQYSDVCYQILREEKMDTRKLVVMGQSFGGGIASAFAYKYPVNVKILILIDSALGKGQKNLDKVFIGKGPEILKFFFRFPPIFQKIVLKMVFNANVPARESKKELQRRMLMVQNYTDLLKKSAQQNISIIDRQYADFPIIMIWGDRDGKEFNVFGSCDVDYAKKLAAKMEREGKNVYFITVRGGHTILYQKPRMVIDAILQKISALCYNA